ncbi:hypothetical protein [Merismopedia glauca]|uniref:Uncharacterized protein n=1 Tax=Merismopedia glauca CCAP 1448/3 TaxID=1296344 RepID=A0A2T1BZJ6_9CYAN|nr:hypothetical protein [Merismopedia glauca]PSB01337.1 hypothetical protein C7B64_18925 [Merismopedia glauca CCAP 1448/3]
MLKKIWRSLSGSETDRNTDKVRTSGTKAPELTENDYEFLFFQLLEGVAHGWQQPRIISFFEVIDDRISQQQWLDWLQSFGTKILASAAPDHNLASRMVQLGEMRCGAIGDLAYDLGMQVLTRGQHPVFMDFNTDEQNSDEADIFEFAGVDMVSDIPSPLVDFPETTTAENVADLAVIEDGKEETEVREVTIDEFLVILQQDPDLAQRLSQELGVNVTDPQAIIQALVTQAEQEDLSSDPQPDDAVIQAEPSSDPQADVQQGTSTDSW